MAINAKSSQINKVADDSFLNILKEIISNFRFQINNEHVVNMSMKHEHEHVDRLTERKKTGIFRGFIESP